MLWCVERRTLSQADSAVSFSKPVSSFRESTGMIIAELSMPSTKPSSHFCAPGFRRTRRSPRSTTASSAVRRSRRLRRSSALLRAHRCRDVRADRVSSELGLVGALYDKLTAAGLKVWWDRTCLRGAKKWEDGFVDGMLNSAMIVPVLSRKLLTGFEKLTTESACDNVRPSSHRGARAVHSSSHQAARACGAGAAESGC